MSTLKSQGIKAFTWHFLGKLGSQGIAFIVSIFLARLLEPAEFGLVAMVAVIIGMAQIFTNIGLGGALVQRRRVLPVHYSSVFYFNISIAILLSLLTFFSAELIAEFYNEEQLVSLAQVMSVSFVITAFSAVQSIRFRKELNFQLLSKIRVVSGLFSGVIGVLLAYNGAGVWSLVALNLSSGIMYNIMIWIASSWRPSLLFSLKALRQLWGFGSRMFVAVLLDTFITRLDVLLIGKLFTPSILGFYQRAKSVNTIVVKYSSGAIIPILFPALSKLQNNTSQFNNVIEKIFSIVNFIVFLLLGFLYVISEELVIIVFTEKWLPSVDYLQIILMSGFAVPIGAVLTTVLSSRGNSKAFLKLEIYKKLLFMLNLTSLVFIGIKEYLYGLVLVALVSIAMDMFFASREMNFPVKYFFKTLITQVSHTLIIAACISFVFSYLDLSIIVALIAKALLFIVLYIVLGLVLKTTSFRHSYEQLAPLIKKKLIIRGS